MFPCRRACLVSGLLFLGCLSAPAADVEAEAIRHAGTSKSHWNFGPFFEYRRPSRQESSFWALRPFYSQVSDESGDTAVHDVLWPLATHHHHFDVDWWRALIAWGDSHTDDPAWSFNLFPLFFCGETRSVEDYWGVFPLYGHHPHFLFMDDWTFALWPIWHSYRIKGVERQSVLWPIGSWYASPREGWGVWPFYGEARQRESRHQYVLWPIVTWAAYQEDRDTSGAGYSWMFWPVSGQVARARENQVMFLPPLFSHARTDAADRWRLPWPFVEILTSTQRDRVSVWPFWEQVRGYSYTDRTKEKADERTWRAGWQLVENTRLETTRMRSHRFSFFPFYTQETRESRGEGPDSRWTEVSSYLRIWPFFAQEREGTFTRRRVLELSPIRHNEGLARNWAPFWTFWESSTRRDGRTHHSLLWHIITWHTAP